MRTALLALFVGACSDGRGAGPVRETRQSATVPESEPPPVELRRPSAPADEARVVAQILRPRPDWMPEHVTVLGRVRDARGAPIARAEVSAISSWSEAGVVRSSVIGGSAIGGTFELDGLHAGEVVLEARAEGFSPARLELGEIEPGDVRFEVDLVLRGERALDVLVVADGLGALAGACVRLDDEVGASFVSDADGRVRFEEVPAREVELHAWWGPESSSSPDASRRSSTSAVVGLGPEAFACLRDGRGRIAHAFERGLRSGCKSGPAWFYEAGVWNGLFAGSYGLQVEDRELGLAQWRLVEVRAGERTKCVVTLEPATRVEVRVRAGGVVVPARVVVRSARGVVVDPRFGVDVDIGGVLEFLLPRGRHEIEARHGAVCVVQSVEVTGEVSLLVELEAAF